MNIKRYEKSGVCSVCKNRYDRAFEIEIDRRFFNTIKICNNCANEMYVSLAKFFVPKSPKNINKNCKICEE